MVIFVYLKKVGNILNIANILRSRWKLYQHNSLCFPNKNDDQSGNCICTCIWYFQSKGPIYDKAGVCICRWISSDWEIKKNVFDIKRVYLFLIYIDLYSPYQSTAPLSPLTSNQVRVCNLGVYIFTLFNIYKSMRKRLKKHPVKVLS